MAVGFSPSHFIFYFVTVKRRKALSYLEKDVQFQSKRYLYNGFISSSP